MCDVTCHFLTSLLTRTALISSNLFFVELVCKDKGVIYTQILGHRNESFFYLSALEFDKAFLFIGALLIVPMRRLTKCKLLYLSALKLDKASLLFVPMRRLTKCKLFYLSALGDNTFFIMKIFSFSALC